MLLTTIEEIEAYLQERKLSYVTDETNVQEIYSRNRIRHRILPEAEGIVSLFCLGPDAEGVTLENLHYPLSNGTLTSGFPLGVSNHFTGSSARITVGKGSILALWDRKNGFPKR